MRASRHAANAASSSSVCVFAFLSALCFIRAAHSSLPALLPRASPSSRSSVMVLAFHPQRKQCATSSLKVTVPRERPVQRAQSARLPRITNPAVRSNSAIGRSVLDLL